jgi:hypothetical protein
MSAVSAAPASQEPSYVFEGRVVQTPVIVQKAVSFSATYLVSAKAARRLVPRRDCADLHDRPDLEVAEVLPGRALFSIACIDYIENDLGDYNEVSLSVFVRRAGEKPGLPYIGNLFDFLRSSLGTYIWQLPVTQRFGCDAGVGIWGFPKTVQQIDIERIGTRQQGKLVMDGEHVLTFSVPFGGRSVIPETQLKTFTHIDDQLFETRFTSGASKVGLHLGGARLTLGNHPVADVLRTLGLPKRALMSVWMGHLHGRFEAPRPV